MRRTMRLPWRVRFVLHLLSSARPVPLLRADRETVANHHSIPPAVHAAGCEGSDFRIHGMQDPGAKAASAEQSQSNTIHDDGRAADGVSLRQLNGVVSDFPEGDKFNSTNMKTEKYIGQVADLGPQQVANIDVLAAGGLV